MTARRDSFVRDLESLCVKYDVQITTSGYDGFELWPLEGQKPDYSGVRDMTDWQDQAKVQK